MYCLSLPRTGGGSTDGRDRGGSGDSQTVARQRLTPIPLTLLGYFPLPGGSLSRTCCAGAPWPKATEWRGWPFRIVDSG